MRWSVPLQAIGNIRPWLRRNFMLEQQERPSLKWAHMLQKWVLKNTKLLTAHLAVKRSWWMCDLRRIRRARQQWAHVVIKKFKMTLTVSLRSICRLVQPIGSLVSRSSATVLASVSACITIEWVKSTNAQASHNKRHNLWLSTLQKGKVPRLSTRL